MRILLTGMTPDHVGTNIGKNFWDTDLIHVGLERAGHTVDRREAIVGEDLSGYDRAVVMMQKLNSITAFYYRYGAIWAASQLPTLLCFEDFGKNPRAPVNALKSRYIWDYPTQNFGSARINKVRDHARAWEDTLNRVVETWLLPSTKAHIIAYQWGKHQQFRELLPQQLGFTDLTAFFPADTKQLVTDEYRLKQWIFATLLPAREWSYDPRISASWPVVNLGKPADVDIVAVRNARVSGKMKHHELVDKYYRTSWGVMSWPYKPRTAGGGIWRDRFHDGINSGNVMHFQPDEVRPLGQPFLVPVEEIEKMNTATLRQLAADQAGAFHAQQLSESHALEALNWLLDNHVNPPIR